MALPALCEPRVVAPSGRLDASAAPRLKEDISTLIDQGVACIIVDLSDVTYLSSSILRVLLNAHKHAQRSGSALALCEAVPQVLRVIRIVGFDQILTICATQEEAVRVLTERARTHALGKETE